MSTTNPPLHRAITVMEPTVTPLPPSVCTNYDLAPNERLLAVSVPGTTGIGLVGILTVPPTSFLSEEELRQNPVSREKHYPPTHRLALILHGKGGHKNYCYQAMVAQALASKLGFYSFRFDFRGCGDSQENAEPQFGRKVEDDIEDIELAYDVFKNGARYAEIGLDLIPSTIIAHSRGSVSMFQWAVRQQTKLQTGKPFQFVPNLINCSARFKAKRLLKELEGRGPFGKVLNQYRFGQYKDINMPPEEVIDLASQDLSRIRMLDEEIQVLSVYGLDDHIVPISDSTYFANLLGSRHQLTFIPYADHNFYGVHEVTEDNSEEYNAEKLPLSKKGRVNYNYKVTDIITEWLHTYNDVQRFKEATQAIYHFPRWRHIDGISNFRDIGGWRTEDNQHYVKAGIIFRCANPSNVSEIGKGQLRELNVKQFFDFRSVGEFTKAGGLSIKGIEVSNVPVYGDVDMSPQSIALRYRNLLASWYTYKYVYEEILIHGAGAYRTVLLFIRDHPNTGVAYNCTAGKDRTGVMTMLILLLLGVDYHTIAKEYELTTVGLVPDHAKIKAEFTFMLEKFAKKTANDPVAAKAVKDTLSLDSEEMFQNMVSSKYESMIGTIELFNTKLGGVEKYSKEHLGLTDEDIATIRENLLTKASPHPDSNSIWKHRAHMGSLL